MLNAHYKNGFGRIPYFLEITDVGEAYLIFETISVLLEVHFTNRPHRLKTQMCFAIHNCVVPIKTHLCFESKYFCVLPYAWQLLSHL